MSKLSDAIWVTRKCHINAEERLNRQSLTANISLTAYSTYLLIASVIAVKVRLSEFELVSLVGAVLTLVASVFVWGLRFSERAAQFKASYIRLRLLLDEAQLAETQNDQHELKRINHSYADILQSCENHSELDYLKLRFELRNSKQKTVEDMTTQDYVRYYAGFASRVLGRIFLLLGPIAALYWYVRGT